MTPAEARQLLSSIDMTPSDLARLIKGDGAPEPLKSIQRRVHYATADARVMDVPHGIAWLIRRVVRESISTGTPKIQRRQ